MGVIQALEDLAEQKCASRERLRCSKMKAIYFAIAVLLGMNNHAHATVQTLTGVKMKIYGVWVADDDCSNPIKVFENTTASVQDLLQNPTLGGGDIPDGSYGCVILKISDSIESTWNGGSCVADIFTPGEYYGSTNGDSINDPVNSPSIAPLNSEQQIYLYLSVSGTAGGACHNKPSTVFSPPVGSSPSVSAGGDLLANRFVVSGSSAGTFKIRNLTGVDDVGCAIQASGTIWDFVNE